MKYTLILAATLLLFGCSKEQDNRYFEKGKYYEIGDTVSVKVKNFGLKKVDNTFPCGAKTYCTVQQIFGQPPTKVCTTKYFVNTTLTETCNKIQICDNDYNCKSYTNFTQTPTTLGSVFWVDDFNCLNGDCLEYNIVCISENDK